MPSRAISAAHTPHFVASAADALPHRQRADALVQGDVRDEGHADGVGEVVVVQLHQLAGGHRRGHGLTTGRDRPQLVADDDRGHHLEAGRVERLTHSERAADQVAVVSPGSVVVEIRVANQAAVGPSH
jgi:hypothetical protein